MTQARPIYFAELYISGLPPANWTVEHVFIPGYYIRKIFIPKGTIGTSAEHLTCHPFHIEKGSVRVASIHEPDVIYSAGFWGYTMPNTKRVLFALEDVVWNTFHWNPTGITDPVKIGEMILAPSENPLLPTSLTEEWREGPKRIPL